MTAGEKRLIVLLGYPLRHSLSPLIHNASFEAQELPFEYRLDSVEPENLAEEIARLKELPFVGANITVPHKTAVLDFLDVSSEVVQAVGAANTLVWNRSSNGGTLLGENTDVGGFLHTLRHHPRSVSGPCLILGAGGAARAVAFGLIDSSPAETVVVAARDRKRAEELVKSLSEHDADSRLHAMDINDEKTRVVARDASLIVNATPAGMYPNVEQLPWQWVEDFHEGQLVYDLIYNPAETLFLKAARESGAETMGGLDMLVEQAALSYLMWTDIPIDRPAVDRALSANDFP